MFIFKIKSLVLSLLASYSRLTSVFGTDTAVRCGINSRERVRRTAGYYFPAVLFIVLLLFGSGAYAGLIAAVRRPC